jgi:hypothetical protein
MISVRWGKQRGPSLNPARRAGPPSPNGEIVGERLHEEEGQRSQGYARDHDVFRAITIRKPTAQGSHRDKLPMSRRMQMPAHTGVSEKE